MITIKNLLSHRLNHLHTPIWLMAFISIGIAIIKLGVIHTGAPFVTIDDSTLFNAGFVVWFGNAPPQRMYAESWLAGLISIITYISQLAHSGHIHQLGINFVADAYRDFQNEPTPYVINYRLVMLSIDIATAWLTFLITKNIIGDKKHSYWAALIAGTLYLLSYNSLWCDLVARPDTCTAFFVALGMYCYFRSQMGKIRELFFASAIALGCATGFKLHGAFFVIFVLADQIRLYGIYMHWRRQLTFALISFAVFMLIAGSPLFDPLLYIKLRALNAADDSSPWIHWGDEFITMLRGTGWASIPLILAFLIRQIKQPSENRKLYSLLFMSLLLILLFSAIRQLRAYWMLPALPLFYSLVACHVSQLSSRALRHTITGLLLSIFSWQLLQQISDFKMANYGQLQHWVKENIKPNEPIYIIGYDTLSLPKNTECLQTQKRIIEKQLNQSLENNESFTMRHIRLWEERTQLLQIDMLNNKSENGFNYYGLNSAPIEDLQGILDIQKVHYLLIVKDLQSPEAKAARLAFGNEFTYITTVTAPGGKAGTGGLPYDIYERNH